jgi:pimeloyl-ACP methyl ester carboxylesterase
MLSGVQRDVTASGVRLRVTERGQGDPVLCLHGIFLNRSCWDAATNALDSEFRVIAPDLPGFGESEKPAPGRFSYDIKSFTEAVTDLYGALELGRATVVGHGLGGAVALALAARRPELVSKLILVDALCYPTPLDLMRRAAVTPLVGGLVFKQLLGRTSFRTLFRHTLLSRQSNVSNARLDAYFDSFNAPAARGSALATLRTTATTPGVVADTRRIHKPSLVVRGRHDRVYPAGFAQRRAREIPGAGFELLDTGHVPQEEPPDELGQIIARFLNVERPSLT